MVSEEERKRKKKRRDETRKALATAKPSPKQAAQNKAQRESVAGRKQQQANLATGKFDNQTKAEIKLEKRRTGTSLQREKDKELIQQKKTATAKGLKAEGENLTPQLIFQIEQQRKEAEAREGRAPQGLDRSIEPLPLNTDTGKAQLEQEIRRRAGVPEDFDTSDPLGLSPKDLEQRKNEQKILFERGKVVLRTAGAFGGKFNPLGALTGTDTKTVNEIKTSFDKRKEDVNQLALKVRENLLTPNEALQLIDNAEQDLLDDRQTVKYRSITSTNLRQEGALTDIEETLLQQDRAIFYAREAIAKLKESGLNG